MKSLGLLFIVLIVNGGARAEGAPSRGNPLGPESEIDMLAYKIYQRRLREEQEQRQERERQRQRQIQEQQGLGFMEGNDLHVPQHLKSKIENAEPPQHKLHQVLEGERQGDLRQVHQEEKKPKATETNKEVVVDKVINVDESQQVEPHPTPSYHQIGDNSKLNPLHDVANMADVYFLDLKRDVNDVQPPPAPDPPPPPPPAGGATSEPSGSSTALLGQVQAVHVEPPADSTNDVVITAVVAGCSVAGLVGLVVAGVCWYRLQKNVKAASEAEYPAYGITGPTKERVQSPGDRKLAQSAQMYHYQHQKQQMIALEKANSEMKQDGSDEESEEENEEGDYTVYECPGLAPTGEMEVKNPLFSEDTPVTPTAPGLASDHK